MKKEIVLFISLILVILPSVYAKDITHPITYKLQSDSVFYKYSDFPGTFVLKLNDGEISDSGINSSLGRKIYVYLETDTVVIENKNYPLEQRYFINVESPVGKSTLRLRFNKISAFFPLSYIQENKGKIIFEHPEIYELANTIWILSPSAKKDPYLKKDSEYYKKVEKYFSPYLNHPIFELLDFEKENIQSKYYEFRENSYTFQYENDKITPSPYYYHVMGGNPNTHENLFKTLLPQIEDFAKVSKFRQFFEDNQNYYQQLETEMKTLLPVEDMWQWLEREFPESDVSTYKIIYSPLIEGSHSTQGFGSLYRETEGDRPQYYYEIAMFINASNRLEEKTEVLRKGRMSGIVFTEIDHNYVNPVSYKQYKDRINKAFSNHSYWNSDIQTSYNTPITSFLEYMTHSLFSLWVLDKFSIEDAQQIIAEREILNSDKRGFIKFKEFNRELIRLRNKHKDLKAIELFPLILDWCEQQAN